MITLEELDTLEKQAYAQMEAAKENLRKQLEIIGLARYALKHVSLGVLTEFIEDRQ